MTRSFLFFPSTPTFFFRGRCVGYHQLPRKLFAYIIMFLCNLPSSFFPPILPIRTTRFVFVSWSWLVLSSHFFSHAQTPVMHRRRSPFPFHLLQSRGTVLCCLNLSIIIPCSYLITSHPLIRCRSRHRNRFFPIFLPPRLAFLFPPIITISTMHSILLLPSRVCPLLSTPSFGTSIHLDA